MTAVTDYQIPSEAIEPFAAMLIGRMWARVVEAREKDQDRYGHCMSLWWCILGLEKIAIGVSTATHFTIAMNSHLLGAARLIKEEIGVDPITAPDWGYARTGSTSISST